MMHHRKHPTAGIRTGATGTVTATDATKAIDASAASIAVDDSRKNERRKQRVGIHLVLRCVIGLVLLGFVLFTTTLYVQTSGEHDAHQLVPSSAVGAAAGAAAMGGISKMKQPRKNGDASNSMKTGNWMPKVSNDKKKQVPNYHIIFSTSCSKQMHWESYVLFYHAFKVKQPGNVTRLLSGCSDLEAKEQMVFYNEHIRTLSPRFHIHLTPDFSKVQHHEHENKKENYKYMNKPFSVHHWLENVLGYTDEEGSTTTNKHDDDIVFLIDPDMILLQPLTHDFSDSKYDKVIWVESEKELSKVPDSKIVRHGHPFSQQDGYLSNNWLDLHIADVTLDPASPALSIARQDCPTHWNSGPPYILTTKDAHRVAQLWTLYAPRVHKQFPKLFAEMYGYIIATAHLQLPHTFIKSLVVSTTTSFNREGWALVDQIGDGSVCPFPDNNDDDVTLGGLFGLHYCKRYMLGRRTFWSKYRLRKDILDCAAPLLEVPDPSILLERESMGPPPMMSIQRHGNWTQDVHKDLSPKTVQREAFMLCGLITKTNEALEYYKRRACPEGTGNYSKVYNVHTDTG